MSRFLVGTRERDRFGDSLPCFGLLCQHGATEQEQAYRRQLESNPDHERAPVQVKNELPSE